MIEHGVEKTLCFAGAGAGGNQGRPGLLFGRVEPGKRLRLMHVGGKRRPNGWPHCFDPFALLLFETANVDLGMVP